MNLNGDFFFLLSTLKNDKNQHIQLAWNIVGYFMKLLFHCMEKSGVNILKNVDRNFSFLVEPSLHVFSLRN